MRENKVQEILKNGGNVVNAWCGIANSFSAEALAQDIPVLVGVNGLNTEKFQDFTGGAAEQITPSVEAVIEWFDRVTAQRAAAA